jgi:F0F1-type ATP synthase assembly protein I
LTNNKNDERYRWARQSGVLATIPFLLAVPPVAGVLIGRWIDQKIGTAPAFMIVLMVLGFVAGIREVVNAVKKANLDPNDDKKNKTPDQ